MNVEIKLLSSIDRESILGLGFNGYRTSEVYSVSKLESDFSYELKIDRQVLDQTYTKIWETKDSSVDFFNDVINEKYSYGAYIDKKLVGFVLLSRISWNNTLWIENIRVKESLQGHGIGFKLLSKCIAVAKEIGVRLVGLEAQSTNYPAVQFYKKFGFLITGIDLERYPQRSGDMEQVGILMSYNVYDFDNISEE